ncbi:MAG: type II toxin-antitoxin system RelE/ParE family toxin [Bryobacterales bacterium]|nr:type II toxin-antitoxin system RelE/ParE family toxin [Bryobacterales bacterium]
MRCCWKVSIRVIPFGPTRRSGLSSSGRPSANCRSVGKPAGNDPGCHPASTGPDGPVGAVRLFRRNGRCRTRRTVFWAVAQTCAVLLEQPHAGVPYDSGIVGLAGLRRFPVHGFENYLVFYVPHSVGIDVVRVLHGARDIGNMIAQEEL